MTTVNLSKHELDLALSIAIDRMEERIVSLKYKIKKYSDCPTLELFQANKTYSTWFDWEAGRVEEDSKSLHLYQDSIVRLSQARKELENSKWNN